MENVLKELLEAFCCVPSPSWDEKNKLFQQYIQLNNILISFAEITVDIS